MIYQRWRHETSPSMCCQGGKVTVPAYPPPPPELMRLWFEDSSEARLFRQHSRSINNATALSSFVVNERRQESGTSSVVMQGKLTQLIGSLQPPDGSRPLFAQLYTVDPETEASTREGCFYLPDSLSRPQKAALIDLMWKVVAVLRRENALVSDFTMACESFKEQQVKEGRIVISTKAKPTDAHERTYNLQVVSCNSSNSNQKNSFTVQIFIIIIIIIIITNHHHRHHHHHHHYHHCCCGSTTAVSVSLIMIGILYVVCRCAPTR